MRQKLIRFHENAKLENIIEPGKPLYDKIKGAWQDLFFKNTNPVVIEIGCGRGDYTVGLAREFSNKNFIGIDVKGDRIWFGAKAAQEEELENVAFLRTRIELLNQFFAQNEVDEIWITFPGPRPRKREANRRLTTNKFLDIYKNILTSGGTVHLKTDSDFAYEFTKEILADRDDIEIIVDTSSLYDSKLVDIHHGIKTHFEKRFLAQGKKIKYLAFRFLNS